MADQPSLQLCLVLDAVKIHLRSDVPVGVFLSGGLDSSTMVGLLDEAGIKGMKTFSVGYKEGPAFDESAYAQVVADFFHTDHHTLYVNPGQECRVLRGIAKNQLRNDRIVFRVVSVVRPESGERRHPFRRRKVIPDRRIRS